MAGFAHRRREFIRSLSDIPATSTLGGLLGPIGATPPPAGERHRRRRPAARKEEGGDK
jgi:hypothetical protein